MPPWTGCYVATSRPPAAATLQRRSPERPAWPGRASTHEPTGRETNARLPYQHLAEEFQRRLDNLRATEAVPDPRERQIARLKDENTKLREHIQECDARIEELTQFKDRALSQLAAQHQEILRLRRAADSPDNIHNLPTAKKPRVVGPHD